jgi:hypothetical protein
MSLESYYQKHPELNEQNSPKEEKPSVSEPDSLKPPKAQVRRRGWWPLAIVLLFLILLGVTCPSQADHERALKKAIREQIDDTIDKDNKLVSTLEFFLADGLIGLYTSDALHVEKYLVFSIGKLQTPEGESKTVTIGILSHVFTLIESESDTQ